MRVLDLFSGIGGFSLGLERAGMQTVAFCEIDPYCRAVLAKHWPAVPVYGDICGFNGIECDLICGGFPCQDISVAGKGAGLAGKRSGLWSEYFRLIRELRPRYVIVENVSALLGRGLGKVLGDLASIGYDAEWHCIPASYVGAPHRRDRVWIVAYPSECRHGQLLQSECEFGREATPDPGSNGETQSLAYSRSPGLEGWRPSIGIQEEQSSVSGSSWWSTEPNVGRVANGVPSRVDRLRVLGNAIVPQIAEIIGRAIMKAEGL